MSSRPTPPEQPQDVSSFAEFTRENPEDWFNYCQRAYAYMDALEVQIDSLNNHVSAQDQKIANLETQSLEKDAVERKLLALLKQKDAEVIEATVTARLAQHAALPTVKALTPEASHDSPAEVIPAPHLGTTPPPAAESASSARLSEKLPDPDKFEGNRSDLRRFLQQIHAKMNANADRFPTATSRLTYVAGRLAGKAYELILPCTIFGVPQFDDYPKLLAYLEDAFGDPDRVQNAQNDLYRLRQKNQDFSTYFSEFQRLALEGEMPDDALTPLLFQGISRELQDMLLHNPPPSRRFHQYANHLQTLDNRYRQHQQQIQRYRTPTRATYANDRRPSPRRGRSPPRQSPLRRPAAVPDPMDLSNQRRFRGPNRRENNLCYRCGSSNHLVRDCSRPDTRGTQFRSATVNRPDSPATTTSLPSSRRSTPSPAQMENGVSLA